MAGASHAQPVAEQLESADQLVNTVTKGRWCTGRMTADKITSRVVAKLFTLPVGTVVVGQLLVTPLNLQDVGRQGSSRVACCYHSAFLLIPVIIFFFFFIICTLYAY